MSTDTAGYNDWPSISQAIKAAAKKAAAQDTTVDVNAQITQARFDRFLSRVFAAGDDSEWLLKGGTSILARVPNSRATKDLDLAGKATDLEEATRALQQAVSADLGDHVRFELTSTRTTGLADNQPGVATRRLVFTCQDSATGRKIGDIPVDIVVGPPPIGQPETVTPVNRLDLPKQLVSHPYRLFPIADQIAEKVCATLADNYPGGQRSSRVKDLVDLVILAKTQRVNLPELRAAIAAKQLLSKLPAFTTFRIPDGWERPFKVLAGATKAADIQDARQAETLVAELVEPALRPAAPGESTVWTGGSGWTDPEAAAGDSSSPDIVSGSTEMVRDHVRSHRPVTAYYRRPRSS